MCRVEALFTSGGSALSDPVRFTRRGATAFPSRRRGDPSARGEGKQKIAILGGGVGAVTAAFALTEVPGWQDRYDVTLYQVGWRLGGKGASGRDMSQPHRRIEEHGLHNWFGFYDNAFAIMRRCYEELPELRRWPAGKDPILWGFDPHDEAVIEERVDGRWKHHAVSFPRNDDWPGTGDHTALTPGYAVRMVLAWMEQLCRSWIDALVDAAPLSLRNGASSRRRLAAAADAIQAPLAAILEKLVRLGQAVPRELIGASADHLLTLLDGLTRGLWARVGALVHRDDTARRFWVAMDFGAAVVRGLIRDRVVWHGFHAINHLTPREWLRRHGASDTTLESEWARVLYAQSFAFLDGDPEQPRVAAGAALHCTLRMLFTYRGAFAWKLRSGMGDIVFAPFYRVLRARGVRFRFFHRVRSLRLSDDGKWIDRILIGRQATPKRGEYAPLVRVKNLWCWPNAPDYEQLEEAAAIRAIEATPGTYVNLESMWSSWGPQHEHPVELRRGVDFDQVVLGISLGALPHICGELIQADRRWRRMVEKIPTIRTQAFQVWLKPTLAESGWRLPSPLSTAYTRPFETWGDFTPTLATECWPRAQRPGMVAYVCGPMANGDHREPEWFTDPGFPARERRRALAEMRRYLENSAGHLWPNTTAADGFDWAQLVDLDERVGAERLLAQFWIANVEPTERYVLSVPGSLRYRLRSDRSGFTNLYLAGDWTFNGMNLGCVEAAVMSGMRAARAICGHPEKIIGEDF
jgi:uncharacterized protein with NAD-binding domain and iron-sulfur cluster